MSGFVVYIRLHEYLRQWCVDHYGDPVRFPAASAENAALRVLLTKLRSGCKPQVAGDGRLAVAVPDSREKPAETFNHLTEDGEKALRDMIANLFRLQLWNDLFPLLDPADGQNVSHMPVLTVVRDWCRKNGISQDYDYTIKMKWQRMREAHHFPMKVRSSVGKSAKTIKK